MIVSVASGKGGTGKTTVATNLAVSLKKGVQLLDCDVEAPNAHLFLKPRIDRSESVFASIPEIELDRCNRCRKCVDICRFNVIAIAGKAVLTFPELCHDCGGCFAVCPENAITKAGRKLGEIETGGVNGIEFVHGRLRVGEAMSPPLIKQVRTHTRPDRMTIIDAPPGTSCPVITAMKDTDFVLMVTEPTPFGLNDLMLAAEAVKVLEIPCGLVINRSDIGNDGVDRYARKAGIPVLMEIPFDRKIAEAYSKGHLMADVMPEWREKFRDLGRRIEKLAGAKMGNR